MVSKRVRDMGNASALSGGELFYADDGSSDVKVTATQIKAFSASLAFESIADLRAYGGPVTGEPAVYVNNYYSTQVGGGGMLVYDPSDVTTVDDSGMTIVDAQSRRWKRDYKVPDISVCWFGADPFNVMDSTAAIQSTINFVATSARNSTIYFPPGQYQVTDILTINHPLSFRGGQAQTDETRSTTLHINHQEAYAFLLTAGSSSSQNFNWGLNFTGLRFRCTTSESALQHCFYFERGSMFSRGGLRGCWFSRFSGCAIYFQSNFGTADPYIQNMYVHDCGGDKLGGFWGGDSRGGGTVGIQCTQLQISNFTLEQNINITYRQHAFFDFQYVRQVHATQLVIEGGAASNCGATEVIFLFASNNSNYIDGLHVEWNLVDALKNEYVFEFYGPSGVSPNLGMTTMRRLNVSPDGYTKALVNLNGCGDQCFKVEDFSNFSQKITDEDAVAEPLIEYDNDGNWLNVVGGGISITPGRLGDFRHSSRTISQVKFENIVNYQAHTCVSLANQELPQFFKQGQFLDNMSQGTVKFVVGSVASKGMYTDADEGRVFEIVSNNNAAPSYTLTVECPDYITTDPALADYQVVMAARVYIDRGTGTYTDLRLFGSDTINSTELNLFPGWRIQWMANNFVSGTTYSLTPALASGSFSGTCKLRIASLYVAFGREIPMLTCGTIAGESLTWKATAAPTYGDYVVGDTVWQKTPAVGSPIGFMCTVAGSPGTWVPLANL